MPTHLKTHFPQAHFIVLRNRNTPIDCEARPAARRSGALARPRGRRPGGRGGEQQAHSRAPLCGGGGGAPGRPRAPRAGGLARSLARSLAPSDSLRLPASPQLTHAVPGRLAHPPAPPQTHHQSRPPATNRQTHGTQQTPPHDDALRTRNAPPPPPVPPPPKPLPPPLLCLPRRLAPPPRLAGPRAAARVAPALLRPQDLRAPPLVAHPGERRGRGGHARHPARRGLRAHGQERPALLDRLPPHRRGGRTRDLHRLVHAGVHHPRPQVGRPGARGRLERRQGVLGAAHGDLGRRDHLPQLRVRRWQALGAVGARQQHVPRRGWRFDRRAPRGRLHGRVRRLARLPTSCVRGAPIV